MASTDSTDAGRISSARAGKLRFAAGLVVILAAIGLLVAQGAKNSMVYYITVSELKAKGPESSHRGLRVSGTVVPGTIEQQDLVLRFQMTDGTDAVPVTYRGVVPDTFAENGQVVVEGNLGPQGVFEASFLMAKCPSKYENRPEEKTTKAAARKSAPGTGYPRDAVSGS
jgi:cytochrome c-type biogenesis protein CcmE